MYTESTFVLSSMLATFLVLLFIGKRLKQKIPLAVLLFAASVAAALAGGYGFPLRHLIVGAFGYIYINLVIFTGMILLQILKQSGSLDAISWDILVHFRQHPVVLFFL